MCDVIVIYDIIDDIDR